MSTPQDERKDIKKDALWLFSGGIGASIFSAVEVILLARFLGVEQFGLFTLVMSYVRLINSFVDLKIYEASIKYISEYREMKDTESVRSFIKFFYIIDLLSGVIAFAVCIGLAKVANSFFIKSGEAFQYILILSFSLLISTVNQNSHAILQSLKKFKESAFLRVFHNAMRIVLILVAFIAELGIEGFFGAYVVAAFINFVLLQLFVNRSLAREKMGGWMYANLERIRSKMRETLWFVMNTSVSGFSNLAFSTHIPIMLLGYFSGAEASGLYKIAQSITRIVEKIRGPVYSVLYPAMVRLTSRENYKELRKVIVFSLKEMAKYTIPVCVAIFILADLIVNIAFGEEYAPASGAVRVLIIALTVGGLVSWVQRGMLAFGMSGLRTVFVMLSGVSMVLAMLILVPRYSYMGAAYACFVPVFIGIFVGIPMFSYIYRRKRYSES